VSSKPWSRHATTATTPDAPAAATGGRHAAAPPLRRPSPPGPSRSHDRCESAGFHRELLSPLSMRASCSSRSPRRLWNQPWQPGLLVPDQSAEEGRTEINRGKELEPHESRDRRRGGSRPTACWPAADGRAAGKPPPRGRDWAAGVGGPDVSPGVSTARMNGPERHLGSEDLAKGQEKQVRRADAALDQAPALASSGRAGSTPCLRITTCLLSSMSTRAESPSPMRPLRNSSARESSSRRITARRSGRAP